MSGTPDTTTPVAPEPDDICLRACQPCEGCGQHIPKERTPPLCSKCAPVGREVTTTPAVTEEDRATAELVALGGLVRTPYGDGDLRDRIAAALAAERGKADALRAAMHALAEEVDTKADVLNVLGGANSRIGELIDLAARLRAIADGQR